MSRLKSLFISMDLYHILILIEISSELQFHFVVIINISNMCQVFSTSSQELVSWGAHEIKEVQAEIVPCSVTSMDFFDRQVVSQNMNMLLKFKLLNFKFFC